MTSFYEASTGKHYLPDTVVQGFNLNKRESQLCWSLLQGLSLDDIADELQQPRNVVRLQVNSLLLKTGVDSESKLVSAVLAKSVG